MDSATRNAVLFMGQLSGRDVELIAETVDTGGTAPEQVRAVLSTRPDLLARALSSPELFEAVFAPNGPPVTPYLMFGVLVHRSARDLGEASHVLEWTGPRERLPVFDVGTLRGFLNDAEHRFFLSLFLASFTRVTSGSMWIKTGSGYRRRRYSELDPVRLAEMVESLPASHQPAGYQRLGDVCLFLSGVFPDHTARNPIKPRQRERLAQSAGLHPVATLADDHDLEFHEAVGSAWYRRAAEGFGRPAFLDELADHFSDARRVLNYVADSYLFRFDTGLSRPAA